MIAVPVIAALVRPKGGAAVIEAAIALLIVAYGAVVWWGHEHGADGHRHDWGHGVMAAGYGYRTCRVCGERAYERTG